MRHFVLALTVAVLLISSQNAEGKRTGEENWKQRYKEWREEERTSLVTAAPVRAGTDEAAAVVTYREEKNSVWDSLSEDERDAGKYKHDLKKQHGDFVKKNDEIDAWHQAKAQRQRKYQKLRESRIPKRRQPREYNLERQHRHFEKHNGERNAIRKLQVSSNPPPHTMVAQMARYIVHNSDWAALAYLSRQAGTQGLPLADVLSISDGLARNSTGVPFMYVTPLDAAVQDLSKDNRCSLAMTLAQGDYCRKESLDPEDPRCAHVILTGKLKQIKNGTEEWAHAENIFFDRHPKLRNMPKDHKFRFAKLKISQITLQDYFGGPAFPTLEEYFAVKPEDLIGLTAPAREPEAEILPGATSTGMESVPIP